MAKLVNVSVTGASQKNVTGADVWAATQKKAAQVVIEVTTDPKNSANEWKLIQWTGAEPVKGKPNQCAVDRDTGQQGDGRNRIRQDEAHDRDMDRLGQHRDSDRWAAA